MKLSIKPSHPSYLFIETTMNLDKEDEPYVIHLFSMSGHNDQIIRTYLVMKVFWREHKQRLFYENRIKIALTT